VVSGAGDVARKQPAWPTSIAAANEGQGREAVAQQKERGSDFIKVYDLLPRNVYFAIADEARKRGIPFAGHVPFSVTVAEASDAGQKSIEHLTGVAPGCSAQEEALFAEAHSRLDGFNSHDEIGFDRHRRVPLALHAPDCGRLARCSAAGFGPASWFLHDFLNLLDGPHHARPRTPRK
jgi:hypothetical protein